MKYKGLRWHWILFWSEYRNCLEATGLWNGKKFEGECGECKYYAGEEEGSGFCDLWGTELDVDYEEYEPDPDDPDSCQHKRRGQQAWAVSCIHKCDGCSYAENFTGLKWFELRKEVIEYAWNSMRGRKYGYNSITKKFGWIKK